MPIGVDAGLGDPADVHAKRPLAEHAEDFRRYLAAQAKPPADYVALTFAQSWTAVLDGCRFTKIRRHVQASAVVEYLGTLRKEGKSVKTANDYLAAVKGFTRWLWRDKRSVLDALAGLSKLANGETDVRHARRDFSPDELGLLLEAARQSPKAIRRLSGIDRYFLYLTAAATGFRVSELASMTPESFHLDGDTPTATVQASCTKNRKLAVQPLPLDVADLLREYLRDKAAGVPVWPGKWRRKAVYLIRGDLKEARKNWLQSFQDAHQRAKAEAKRGLPCLSSRRGRPICRLPFRFVTGISRWLARREFPLPREHQDLARHSTYAMPSRYTHSRFYDLAAAVQGVARSRRAARNRKRHESRHGNLRRESP